VTLPENTLRDLQSIDADRGLAIVKLTRKALRHDGGSRSQVAITEMASNIGLVVVGPSRALRKIPFLHLIQVKPGRFLLALEPGNSFTNLEIALNDTLDDLPPGERQERELILQLMEQIRSLRKAKRVRMAEILFVNLKGHTEV
jgi:hypothetical protein